MTLHVKYYYREDADHVARNVDAPQVRRLPVVGILSLADLARCDAGIREVGTAKRRRRESGRDRQALRAGSGERVEMTLFQSKVFSVSACSSSAR